MCANGRVPHVAVFPCTLHSVSIEAIFSLVSDLFLSLPLSFSLLSLSLTRIHVYVSSLPSLFYHSSLFPPPPLLSFTIHPFLLPPYSPNLSLVPLCLLPAFLSSPSFSTNVSSSCSSYPLTFSLYRCLSVIMLAHISFLASPQV